MTLTKMIQFALIFLLGSAPLPAQGDSFSKNFTHFKEIAPGVDFFAANRADVTPFEKPLIDAQRRLASLLGPDLARGAVVVCSSMEQRDSVNETRVLKMGYRWVLIQLTPAATNEQMLAQIRAQANGQLPPGVLERFQNQSPEMRAASEARLVSATIQRVGYGILTTTLAPEKEFRASRLDDVGRSPLPDWVDIGIASHASGGGVPNLRFLQDRLDEAFPLEDVLTMSRPFVPPSAPGAGGPGTFMIRMGGPGGGGPGGGGDRQPGGSGGGGGGRGGQFGASMPKDVQDRMMFDAQSALLFNYILDKAGVEKMKELVREGKGGTSLRESVLAALQKGEDLESLEKDWIAWIKEQKSEGPGGMRIMTNPSRTQTPPQN